MHADHSEFDAHTWLLFLLPAFLHLDRGGTSLESKWHWMLGALGSKKKWR